MDKRIFVEKKADFRVKSHSLLKELQHNLQLKTLKDLRIVQVYDVFNLAEDLFARAEKHIFSEQVTDTVLDEARIKADLEKVAFFACFFQNVVYHISNNCHGINILVWNINLVGFFQINNVFHEINGIYFQVLS